MRFLSALPWLAGRPGTCLTPHYRERVPPTEAIGGFQSPMVLRLLPIALLACVASTSAQLRWRKKKPITYMNGIEDPHQGHTQGPGELYPGHKQHMSHPYLAPSHANHRLLTAALQADVDEVKKLLREGIPVDFMHDHDGHTALHYACMNMSLPQKGKTFDAAAVVKLLLEHGADPEITDNEGVTPLMTACQKAFAPAVKLLLEAGVQTDRKQANSVDRGKTALDFARRSECRGCVALLEHPPDRQHALAARRHRAEDMLSRAIRTYTSWAWTALMHLLGYQMVGDECWLHRALDIARATAGVDPALIEQGQALRGQLSEQVMDLIERRHVCEEVVAALYAYELYALKDLSEKSISLEVLADITGLSMFEAHMLQMGVERDITRHQMHKRYHDRDAEEAQEKAKDELRRLQEGIDRAAATTLSEGNSTKDSLTYGNVALGELELTQRVPKPIAAEQSKDAAS